MPVRCSPALVWLLNTAYFRPKGVPVATFAIGAAGAANAGLFAARMLAMTDPAIATALDQFRDEERERARHMELPCIAT